MKEYLFPILFAMIFTVSNNINTIADSTTIRPMVTKESLIDKDLLKKEIQDSVLEFIIDSGLNPDSTYIPFKKK